MIELYVFIFTIQLFLNAIFFVLKLVNLLMQIMKVLKKKDQLY